jgi:hypothetical protein
MKSMPAWLLMRGRSSEGCVQAPLGWVQPERAECHLSEIVPRCVLLDLALDKAGARAPVENTANAKRKPACPAAVSNE